jgi:hypothetical protein
LSIDSFVLIYTGNAKREILRDREREEGGRRARVGGRGERERERKLHGRWSDVRL